MIESYTDFKSFLTSLKTKPRLLLHVCCAPCSSHALLLLYSYFDITIFFSNDNISPKQEFEKRLEELHRFILQTGLDVKIVEDAYEYNRFQCAVRGKEALGERSIRCYNCYYLRMDRTARYAYNNHFDYFTTVLSISPHKVSKWINEIGNRLENEIGCPFLYSDFKKEDGYKHSIELSKQYHLYRQEYCGCEYSKSEKEVQCK